MSGLTFVFLMSLLKGPALTSTHLNRLLSLAARSSDSDAAAAVMLHLKQ